MKAVMNLPHTDQWNITSMKMTDIPMVVSWMDTLASHTKIETNQIIVQLKGEMELARKTDFPEYFIAFLEQQAIFFMTGHFINGNDPYPGNKGDRKDYKISLLLFDPHLYKVNELFLPAWHHILKYLFERRNIGRVLVAWQEFDNSQKEILERLCFLPMDEKFIRDLKNQYYTCRRTDFLNLISL